MAKRDQRARLIDNIGRQIRRLRARERTADDYQKIGIKRNIENLDELRQLVKETNKNDKRRLNDLEMNYKSNDNFSTSQKKIDDITRKIIGAQPAEYLDEPDEIKGMKKRDDDGLDEPPKPEYEDEEEIEEEDEEEEKPFLIEELDEFQDIFDDLMDLEGQYIGVYDKNGNHDQAMNLLDKIDDLAQKYKNDLSDDQKSRLTNLYRSIEDRATNAKGNYIVLDTQTGERIGRSGDWSQGDTYSLLFG